MIPDGPMSTHADRGLQHAATSRNQAAERVTTRVVSYVRMYLEKLDHDETTHARRRGGDSGNDLARDHLALVPGSLSDPARSAVQHARATA